MKLLVEALILLRALVQSERATQVTISNEEEEDDGGGMPSRVVGWLTAAAPFWVLRSVSLILVFPAADALAVLIRDDLDVIQFLLPRLLDKDAGDNMLILALLRAKSNIGKLIMMHGGNDTIKANSPAKLGYIRRMLDLVIPASRKLQLVHALAKHAKSNTGELVSSEVSDAILKCLPTILVGSLTMDDHRRLLWDIVHRHIIVGRDESEWWLNLIFDCNSFSSPFPISSEALSVFVWAHWTQIFPYTVLKILDLNYWCDSLFHYDMDVLEHFVRLFAAGSNSEVLEKETELSSTVACPAAPDCSHRLNKWCASWQCHQIIPTTFSDFTKQMWSCVMTFEFVSCCIHPDESVKLHLDVFDRATTLLMCVHLFLRHKKDSEDAVTFSNATSLPDDVEPKDPMSIGLSRTQLSTLIGLLAIAVIRGNDRVPHGKIQFSVLHFVHYTQIVQKGKHWNIWCDPMDSSIGDEPITKLIYEYGNYGHLISILLNMCVANVNFKYDESSTMDTLYIEVFETLTQLVTSRIILDVDVTSTTESAPQGVRIEDATAGTAVFDAEASKAESAPKAPEGSANVPFATPRVYIGDVPEGSANVPFATPRVYIGDVPEGSANGTFATERVRIEDVTARTAVLDASASKVQRACNKDVIVKLEDGSISYTVR